MYQQIAANKRRSLILIMLTIAFLIGLGYVYSQAMGDLSYSGVWIAIIVAFFITGISYFWGDKIALSVNGAKPLTEAENPTIYHLVENLCIASGQPTPAIYIINDPAINAFATGRKPMMASIAITSGALQKLDKSELEGVIAHELSHVQNYDMRFMTLVAVLVGAISLLSHFFLRVEWFMGGRRSDNRDGNQLALIFMFVGVVLAILSPLIAQLIKMAISRRREYLADASGALLTRYPAGLAGALEKIKADALPMKNAAPATAHLYLANPFKSGSFANLFSTHPPLEERIKRLREMAV